MPKSPSCCYRVVAYINYMIEVGNEETINQLQTELHNMFVKADKILII